MKKIYTLLSTLLIASAAMAQAPTLVADINPGVGNSLPANLYVSNDLILLSAGNTTGDDVANVDKGLELWSSDGNGASFIKDIYPGVRSNGRPNSSVPQLFTEFNGMTYFVANDGDSSLWITDGTESGTIKDDQFPNINEGPLRLLVVENILFYTAQVNSGDTNQLVEYDGTTAVISPDAVNPDAKIQILSEFVNYSNTGELLLYANYSADDANLIGNELYAYNYTTDTFRLVKDIAAGTKPDDASDPNDASISNMTIANGVVYFEALNGLWQTDGTEAGTIEVPAAVTLALDGVNNLYNFNGNLLFEADNGAGDQLWILNTTTGSITQISTNTGTNMDHDPSDYTTIGNLVYYRGESSNSTDGFLFRTDGVTTAQLDDTVKDVDDVIVFNGLLYFEGEDLNAALGNELYVFDPATASVSREERNNIKMYPNPSNNGIVNFTGNIAADSSFEINDLSGRMVLKGSLQNSQLQHDLNTGVYFIKLENQDNAFKLVVE